MNFLVVNIKLFPTCLINKKATQRLLNNTVEIFKAIAHLIKNNLIADLIAHCILL
jgi:methyl coenzyme M reductase subunit D